MATNYSRLYKRGAAFEYRVKHKLEKEGWLVIRSAGSHSPVDLIAAKGGEIWVIQCKAGQKALGKVEREDLKAVALEFGSAAYWCYPEENHNIIMEEVM